jgi:hypothetical protein
MDAQVSSDVRGHNHQACLVKPQRMHQTGASLGGPAKIKAYAMQGGWMSR